MQKKLSHSARQMNSLRIVKASFRVGTIIVFLQMMCGCEPLNPDDNKKKNNHETTPNEIVQKPEINDWEDD